jgi:hypothetical protein
MEVHAHTHTARKKWTHYFWEFLMLFLAVFCGFFAEYQLEHKIEKDREKQYMLSLLEDLQSDTAQLAKLIDLFDLINSKEDSLKWALKQPDLMNNPSLAYPYLGYPLDGYAFHRSERTIQQLKNAGGLRLIHSIKVSNKINEYDESYRQSSEINGVAIETYHYYTAALNKVADASFMGYPYKEKPDESKSVNAKWITNDPKDLQVLYNYTVNFQWVNSIYTAQLKGLRTQAIELMGFLKDEYRMK